MIDDAHPLLEQQYWVWQIVGSVAGAGLLVFAVVTYVRRNSTPEYLRLLEAFQATQAQLAGRDVENRLLKENINQLEHELALARKRDLADAELPDNPLLILFDSKAKRKTRVDIEQKLARVVDHFTLGYEADLREDWPEALKHYEAALAEERTVAVLNNLALVYRRMSRFAEAISLCNEAIQISHKKGLTETWQLVSNLGALHFARGQYSEALDNYNEADVLRKQKGLPAAYGLAKNRGNVYTIREQYENALTEYQRAESLRREQGLPEDWELMANLGGLYDCLGKHNDALAAYLRAEKLRSDQGLPDEDGLVLNKGVVYVNIGDYPKALEAFLNARDIRETRGLLEDADIARNLGAVYDSLGQYKEALAEYSRAETLRREQGLPVDPTITFNKALVYYAQDDQTAACQLACQARDMYTKHHLQAPVRPNILTFIKNVCPGGCNGNASAAP